MEKNVQVAVRVRPMNEREKALQRPSVVTAQPKAHQITVRKKTYTFDRVFGQYATQKDVFKGAVQNAADEALSGFNCTVFAYGQTGTGKTHTIQGTLSPNHENAGIIPRSVNYIFEKLQATKREYSVRVSFLQLYNEECKDLLSENRKDKPLRLMEDIKRGGVYCQNLEEVTTLTASHVYELLETGAKNRMTAETLLNDQSSRSHCIFTIRIHSKEANVAGEDILRSGTLNLVDLAGSECIGRSGARNARAREAGNINQSLLTLGRVITALVDKHPHVPYRDSKLTRLLQESLGGKAMTTIIATVGPGCDCVDETLSTLDYAHRAKSIKNKPEANQRMTKHVLIKEYSQEIDALRSQLIAARNKDGIYLPTSQFAEMQERITGLGTQLGELEDELERKSQQILELEDALDTVKTEHADVAGKLQQSETRLILIADELEAKEGALAAAQDDLRESRDLLRQARDNETQLVHQAQVASAMYHSRVNDIQVLQAKLDRKHGILTHNAAATTGFADGAAAHCAAFEAALHTYREQHRMHVVDIQTTLGVATSQFATDLARVQSEVQGIHTTMQHALQVVGAAMDGHEITLGEQTDSMSTAMRAQSVEWTAQIHRLKPLVATQTKHIQQVLQGLEEATQQLTADLSTQLCHTSKHMETASQAQVERLDAIKESVARALADHAAAAGADKDRVVAALTSTQVDLQNQVQIIQQLVQVQLDACVSTVSQALANQRTAVQSQHDDAVSRLQSITTSVDSAVTALSEGTISQGTALQCHVDATSALVDGFARSAEKHGQQIATSLADQTDTVDEWHATMDGSMAAGVAALELAARQHLQDNVRAVQSSSERVRGEVRALATRQEDMGSVLQSAAQAMETSVAVSIPQLEMVAAAADGHVVSCVNEVQRQLHEVAELSQTLQSDAASTPLSLPQDSFPTFQVQSMASTGVKRKSDDKDTTGGVASRLQPPKKYAKSNCDTVVSA